MVVLGLTPNHDASACVIIDGKIVSAITRERLSRHKKSRFISQKMLDYLFAEANITIDDVDYVGISYWFENREDWRNENEDIKLYIPKDVAFIFSPSHTNNNQELWSDEKPEFVEGLGYRLRGDLSHLCPPSTNKPYDSVPINFEIYGRVIPGWFVNHHQAHAASTYYTSNFDEAAVFTMDATDNNPWVCSLFSYGYKNKLETLYYPGIQIGHAYSQFTEMLGIGHAIFKAGSMMGLAAYGKPNLDVVKNINKYTKSYWERNERGDDWRWIYRLFMDTTGKVVTKYAPETPAIGDNYIIEEHFNLENSDSQEAMDASATIQFVFEETVFKFARELWDETKKYNGNNLCLAGGSFLNCTTNGKIHKNTPFKNIHVYPGAADDGLSVGSALYVTHHLLGIPRVHKTVEEVVYTGKKYSTPEGGKELSLDFIASKLNEGKVIAWFQGGSEFGPRALGNRSFLANPCIAEMRDYINFEIKNREWYRPFAPSVCIENAQEYFDIDGESPFMLKICDVLSDKIPAVTHIDGSARPQTVKREDNPIYYDLIRHFERYSGVPVLLNTSLNLSHEPIVETPEDAMNLFHNSKVDILVINNSMWVK